MKARGHRLWIALFSATAVGLVAVVNFDRTAPGPLARVHAEQTDLQGRWSCSACHGNWGESMTHACLDCHEDIEAHIDGGRGLHGSLDEERVGLCATCHSEHHGDGFGLVNVMSFSLAGIEEVQDFDHGLVGFEMEGAHLELDCTECHEYAEMRFLPEGARRYIGLEQDCVSCHEDPHEGQLGQSCVQCHGQSSFDELESVGHERFLALEGGHAAMECRTCHEEGDEHSLEALAESRLRPEARDCGSCHGSPHTPSFTTAVAARVEMNTGAACITCHLAPHVEFVEAEEVVDADLHALADFPLDAPHDALDCEDCHAPEADWAERYPGRERDACAACHDDPHDGQFEQGPFAGQGCITCHDRAHFEPHAFGPAEHELTSLVLSGSHLETDCDACHEKLFQNEARVFAGTSNECESCHSDAHRGAFDGLDSELMSELAEVEHGRCARCHHTDAFREVAHQEFDHGLWTAFGVDGAHAQERCVTCHPRSDAEDENGRRFGFVNEHYGDFEGCVTCHEDPHQGRFDGEDMPASVGGRSDCARCHGTTSFREISAAFDHRLWTGWGLDGAHEEASCTACHSPLRRPDEFGRTWGRAAGSDCADCHADPHAGQFQRDGRTDCSRCHQDESVWSDLVFNHDRDSRFPLEDAHEKLACSACHGAEVVSGSGAVGAEQTQMTLTRYRPMRTDCVGCHGSQRGPMLRRRRSRGNGR